MSPLSAVDDVVRRYTLHASLMILQQKDYGSDLSFASLVVANFGLLQRFLLLSPTDCLEPQHRLAFKSCSDL